MGFYGLTWVFMENGGFPRLTMGATCGRRAPMVGREPVDKCVICCVKRIGDGGFRRQVQQPARGRSLLDDDAVVDGRVVGRTGRDAQLGKRFATLIGDWLNGAVGCVVAARPADDGAEENEDERKGEPSEPDPDTLCVAAGLVRHAV